MCENVCNGGICCGQEHAVASGWYNLPVAPKVVAGGRSVRTPVTPVLMPEEALACLEDVLRQGADVKVVDVSGPGDPLAIPGLTLDTLQMVHDRFPELDLNITTLGIKGDRYAGDLAAVGLTCVTLQIDAVDVETVRKLYSWVRPGNKTIPLARAVELLLDEQRRALAAFKLAGCRVHVRTTVYPGCNDHHVVEVAALAAANGADAFILALCEPEDGIGEEASRSESSLLHGLAAEVKRFFRDVVVESPVKEMSRPDRCREKGERPEAALERPNVAVVSSDGVGVDLHLGQAVEVLVFGPEGEGRYGFLGSRKAPEKGGGDNRWRELAGLLADCSVLLVAGVGEKPKKILQEAGVAVMTTRSTIAFCLESMNQSK